MANPSTSFTLPASLPSWPPGNNGFGMGTMDLGGGLEVMQISSFTKVWSTTDGATFYAPSPVPAGFSMLGSYAQADAAPLFGWVLVARDVGGTPEAPSLAEPVDYGLVWSGGGDEQDGGRGYFWLPVAPEGYRPVGLLVTASPDKPSLGDVRCVREELTDECEEESSVWASDGFNVSALRPALRGVDAPGVHVGTFTATTNGTLARVWCLKNDRLSTHQSMPDLAQINTLAAQYGPLIYFHPDEKYLCSSVDFLFSNGGLLYSRDSPDAPSAINPDGSNLPQGDGDQDSFWVDLPQDDRRDKVMGGELESAEVYLHVKPMLGGTFTDLAFWVFHPFNGPATAKLLLIQRLPLGKIGEHVGDWEHVTVRVSNLTGQLWRVYFSAHSGGEWKDASELEFQNGTNKPVSYSSLNGHAMYSKPGLVLQGNELAGIRNDTARGELLDAGNRFNLVAAEHLGGGVVAEPPWLNYYGRWGPTITYDIANELQRVSNFLPGALRTALENAVSALLPSELFGQEGPSGPKQKSNWAGDEKI